MDETQNNKEATICSAPVLKAAIERLISILELENTHLQHFQVEKIADTLEEKQDIVRFISHQEALIKGDDQWHNQLSLNDKETWRSMVAKLEHLMEENVQAVELAKGYKDIIMHCITKAIEKVCEKNNDYDYKGRVRKPRNPVVTPSLSFNKQT